MPRHLLVLPDLGIPDQPMTLSLWLVKQGSRVAMGDPVVEILAGAATMDLPAPADGRLVQLLVAENEPVSAGQTLAVMEEEAEI